MKIIYHSKPKILIIKIFNKLFIFTLPKVEFFPTFYYRSIHCCDHGGRAVNGRLIFIWSTWHLKKLQKHDIGDGPDTWTRVSFRSVFKNYTNNRGT